MPGVSARRVCSAALYEAGAGAADPHFASKRAADAANNAHTAKAFQRPLFATRWGPIPRRRWDRPLYLLRGTITRTWFGPLFMSRRWLSLPDVARARGGERAQTVLPAYSHERRRTMLGRAALRVARRRQHIVGRAIEHPLRGANCENIRRRARGHGLRGGCRDWVIRTRTFIHIDSGPVRSGTIAPSGARSLLSGGAVGGHAKGTMVAPLTAQPLAVHLRGREGPWTVKDRIGGLQTRACQKR